MQHCCLGEYKYKCSSLPNDDNSNVFIDIAKTRQVAVISPCGTTPLLPSEDAVLVHEILGCPNNCDIRWYECINTYGRTYTILVSPCEVIISLYENGLLKLNNCDASIFGSESFEFGKVHIENQNYITDRCTTIFEFDNHVFEITGNVSNSFGLFECNQEPELTLFSSSGKGESIPEAPADIEPQEINDNTTATLVGDIENKVTWNNLLPEAINSFVSCSSEQTIGNRQQCESFNNSTIARLQSGQSVIAYEKRQSNGITGIELCIINSTVPKTVFYHRSLSFGKLVNDNQFVYGSGVFEIYDDIFFELNNNDEPIAGLSLGFLSGPLKGKQVFPILTIKRDEHLDGYKHSINFDSLGIVPNFSDSNDLNDVSFFILSGSTALPGGEDLLSAVTIPQHLNESGSETPMLNPSVAVAQNNLMIDRSQNIFLSYQSFETNQWNVYVIHIRITEKDSSPPSYKAPYNFLEPNIQQIPLTSGTDIKYKLVSINDVGDGLCALFDIYTLDDHRIRNCIQNSETFIHPCGSAVDNSVATIEVTYVQTGCSYEFDLEIGDEILADFPPLQSDFPDGNSSSSNSCILSFSINPSASTWCYFTGSCPQTYLIDDPYCPSPYIAFIYKPEDLWVINVGESFVTRVKYHIAVADSNARVIERDEHGYAPSFIKNAEIYITYSGDISDVWTNNKTNLVFSDNAPSLIGNTKGLTQFPFDVVSGKIYGVDPVHIDGNINNWMFWGSSGQLVLNYPNIGIINSGKTLPILVSNNSIKPIVKANNRNDVFVIYENYDSGLSQIKISGTGDFYQSSITGAKSSRITKFLNRSDFVWSHDITLFSDMVNQLSDAAIDFNDVVHVTWQSNRDKRWEIYYANSSDMFNPIRVTDSDSRSAMPRIDVDKSGTVYIVYQDNRFGPFQIMLAAKDEKRIIPLLQQDAYLASLRENYQHYTNILPVTMNNSTSLEPTEGSFWGTKISSGNGNANENFIFSINTNTGNKTIGCNSSPYQIVAIASSRDGFLYGIDLDNKLLLIDSPNDDEYIDNISCENISEIGVLSLNESSSNIEMADNFDSNGSIDSLKWVQVPMYSFDPVDGPDGNWFIIPKDASQCNGSLDVCNPICGGCEDPIHTSGYVYGIMSLNPILPKSISIRARIKWLEFSPENTDSPEIKFVFKNHNISAPFHGLTFKMNACSGSGCSQSLAISYSDGPEIIIDDFAPFKENWTDVRIDCVETNGTIEPRKNLTISVFINDIEYYSHTRTNLSPSDSGMGSFYGIGSYSFYDPFQPDIRTGKFILDDISFLVLNPESIENSRILDMAFDHVGRSWVLVGDRLTNRNFNLRLLQIDKTASINNQINIYRDVSERTASLTIDSDGNFYFIRYENGLAILSKSKYPTVTLSDIILDIEDISILQEQINLIATDFQDQIFAVDKQNRIHTLSPVTGELDFKSDLSEADSPDDPYMNADPIGTLSGFTYKYNGRFSPASLTNNFHILIEFYDNINLDGNPVLVINSSSSPESFVGANEDAYFSGINGIQIQANHSALIYFYAISSFGFEKNITYFPRVYAITQGEPPILMQDQNTSFSCNKCSINTPARWQSSGFGYSDTKVTDSVEQMIAPVIRTRSSEAAVILFEDHSASPHRIKGATFRKSEPDDQKSSGTRNWFDYDFGIEGTKPDIEIDLYDRVSMTYEKTDDIFGKGTSETELPTTAVFSKNCAFTESSDVASNDGCDISQIEANVITSDEFVSDKIVKQILVKSIDVDYFTYTSSGEVVPVVSKCEIGILIWGTPEVVAYRIRNENQNFWSSWCAYSPEITNNYTESKWKISSGSGIKEVCIQFMTYSGITTEKCIGIIGDYIKPRFEVKMYSDSNFSNVLPEFNEILVTSTLYNSNGSAAQEKLIYIEIIPEISLTIDAVSFDVLQQGTNDIHDLQAVKHIRGDGRQVYRGNFTVHREDNIVNKDGLAKIVPNFPATCENVSAVVHKEGFSKDDFNLMTQNITQVDKNQTDDFETYRQETSGVIGVGVIMRPSKEDPYFIFGSHNFYTMQDD